MLDVQTLKSFSNVVMEQFDSMTDVQPYGAEDYVGFYEFQPLPTLLEDEENVSLADILSLRDSCLLEEDVWAFCLECCLSLKDISHSSLFQILCITPDTLAFNANGNVCFMEQLSDDPEGAFVPPEFDLTGNTFAAHVYSLGRTLQIAIDYVTEPETEPELSQDLMTLLEQMQQEDAEDRPDVESIISLCEAKLMHTSSNRICRNLSAIGRRVLSIESVGPWQDDTEVVQKKQEDSITAKHTEETCERNPADGSSSTEELAMQDTDEKQALLNKDKHLDSDRSKIKTDQEDLLHIKVCNLKDDVRTDNIPITSEHVQQEMTISSQNELPAQATEVIDKPDAATLKVDRTGSASEYNVPEFENFASKCIQSTSFQQLVSSSNAKQPKNAWQDTVDSLQSAIVLSLSSDSNSRRKEVSAEKVKVASLESRASAEHAFFSCPNLENENIKSAENIQIAAELGSGTAVDQCHNELEKCMQSSPGVTQNKAVILHSDGVNEIYSFHSSSPHHSAAAVNGTHLVKKHNSHYDENEPEDCSSHSWIKLHDLLSQYGKPLKDYELWALCHECLCTLLTYIEFPAYLCLNSITIDRSGAILFATPDDTGSSISLFAAPELDTSSVVMEKACVYSVAAILWTAAKCNIKENHQLTLPRKLKQLLLNMAKKNPSERLSIIEAQQICKEYLHQEKMSSKQILAQLISTFQAFRNVSLSAGISVKDAKVTVHSKETTEPNLGFVPIKSKSRLTAIKGPVPCQYPLHNEPSNLPDAFTSPVTHFKPIIITQNIAATSTESAHKNAAEKKQVKAIKREIQKKTGTVPLDEIENDASLGGPAVPQSSKWESPKKVTTTESITLECSKEKNSNDSFPSALQSASAIIASTEQREEQMKTALSSSSENSTVSYGSQVNNFLLRQDPKTGVLTLVPIQVAVPEQLSGMQFQTAPYDLLPKQQVGSFLNVADAKLNANSPGIATDGSMSSVWQVQNNRLSAKNQDAESTLSDNTIAQELTKSDTKGKPLLGSKDVIKSKMISLEGSPLTSMKQTNVLTQILDESSQALAHDTKMSSLEKVIRQIQEEFAFEGYLDNGTEDVAMGEYILALKGLTFGTFCGAVSEKFNDLYWDERLLLNLYEAVNGKPPQPLPVYHAGLEIQNAIPTDHKSENEDEEDSILLQILKKAINKRNKAVFQTVPSVSPVSVSSTPEDGAKKSEILSGEAIMEQEECITTETEVLPQAVVSFDEMDLPDSIYLPQENERSSSLKTKDKTSIRRAASLSSAHYFSPTSAKKNDVTDISKMAENQYPAPTSSKRVLTCNVGWRSAFFGAQIFDQEVQCYVTGLGSSKASDSSNMDSKIQEVEQHLMIEVKHYKKTQMFYQKLLHKERRNKSADAKAMLCKLKEELEEMKIKVQFLETVKMYLEVLKAEQWGLDISLLSAVVSASSRCEMEACKPLDSSQLMFHSVKEHERPNQNGVRILQAGTTAGLMAYLYSSNAVLDGYIQQFLYTYRYFCTPKEFLQFIIDCLASVSRTHLDTVLNTRVYNRSLYLLQTWIEDCYKIDFTFNTKLLDKLEDFIASKAISVDSDREHLISLIQHGKQKEHGLEFSQCCSSLEEVKKVDNLNSMHTSYKNMSINDPFRKSFRWKSSKLGDATVPDQKTKQYTVATALPKLNLNGFVDDMPTSYIKKNEKGPHILAEWTAQHLAFQLTLLQQEMFQKCHAVHFLNSRAIGVKDKNIAMQKSAATVTPPTEGTSLFVPLYKQDRYLLELLKYGENISTWVSAEIVTCDRPKLQTDLLSKFLLVAKYCYEIRNFETSMQVLVAMDNVTVRQLPAWKNLPSKVCEIMEELRAVEVFLKSDALCLMVGDRFRKLPTIPSSHLLAMHVQQLETGGFTMTSGAHKWPKLRNISKVVSQIPAFQEQHYELLPDLEMQTYLQHRIIYFSEADIPVLAAKNTVNFHKLPADKHSRKIQNTLRRMKATFQ